MTDSQRPTFAIMGSGAVGAYFGGRLAEAGFDVTFIARGAHLEALRTAGLVVHSPFGDIRLASVVATDRPDDVGPVDFVLLGVKLYDVESAGAAMKTMVGPDTAIITVQNGVDSPDMLAGVLGSEHVMGGVIYIPAAIEAPGVIRHLSPPARIVFGEMDGTESSRAGRLRDAFAETTAEGVLSDNIRGQIWSKFVLMSATSAICGLSRLPVGGLRSDEDGRRLFEDAMAETVAVATARGIELPGDVIERQMGVVDTFDAGVKASLLHDLERGKRLELPWLSGAVVRLGKAARVATPIHRIAYAALKPFADGPPPDQV